MQPNLGFMRGFLTEVLLKLNSERLFVGDMSCGTRECGSSEGLVYMNK